MTTLKFNTMLRKDSKILLGTIGKNAILKPFVKALEDLTEDQIGHVQATRDISVVSIRRRLTNAANLLNMEIEIERDDATIYYWIRKPTPTPDNPPAEQPQFPPSAMPQAPDGDANSSCTG